MCGRYSQTASLAELKAHFGFLEPAFALKPRYNIAPSQDAPVVIGQDERRLEMFHWGLIPSWAKDAAIGNKMINARRETISDKPSFKRLFARSRCLVLADGFYEWRKDALGQGKTPMRIALKSCEPFAMAGLWDAWKTPAGREVRSFAIITTAANDGMRPIHDRMPVILRREDEAQWLDAKVAPEKLKTLLAPYADEALEAYAVSRLVNSPANDTAECMKKDGSASGAAA